MRATKTIIVLVVFVLILIPTILFIMQLSKKEELLPEKIINTEQPFDGQIPE